MSLVDDNPAPQFNACTIRYSGLADRIFSKLRISEPRPAEEAGEPVLPVYDTVALWDTGASKSVITRATAEALSLAPVGTIIVNHAGGSMLTNRYLVNIYLPNDVLITGVLVCECPDGTKEFGAIVGMDIIGRGDFAITNVAGQTCMSFRIPSVATVDYVHEGLRNATACEARQDSARVAG